jgi:drug/metabolite transporter (DMT)-like permease
MVAPASSYLAIAAFALLTSFGDVLMSRAMTKIGDLGELRARRGIHGTAIAVFCSGAFWLALIAMAASFFSLLTALSWADLSLVAPASSALVFVLNTLGAKFYLREKVDTRRWTATALVCAGIFLVTR